MSGRGRHNLAAAGVSDLMEHCMSRLLLLAADKPVRHAVSIKDMRFDPASIDVKLGDTIVWTNNDDRDHTVVARDGSFKSDNLKPGASYSFKLTQAGKLSYACSYHPRMKGSINVTDK
jgi:plastocyanin